MSTLTRRAGRASPRPAGTSPRRRRSTLRGREGLAGWLFVAPAVVLLIIFLAIPVGMALWVSFTDWQGFGSPFTSSVPMAGGDNYASLITEPGLVREDFMTSIRNTFYYMLFVVPLQTVLALSLALIVNAKMLRGKGFFRSAFYFPSVTSSVAISVVFLFLFADGGSVNAILGYLGIHGPNWFNDSHGLFHLLLAALHVVDINNPPSALASNGVLGLSWWDWMSGPSVAMCTIIMLVVWTTSGTFMLMYLAALQNVPVELEESALLDGAGWWRRLRYVVLPLLKPTTFLVITLGVIATWQVFDQIYITTQGGPDKTSLSPAFLSFRYGFGDHSWGVGAAMAFVLFAIIIALTLLQRYVMRDKDAGKQRRRERIARRRRHRQEEAAA